jgi:hypothetical protein
MMFNAYQRPNRLNHKFQIQVSFGASVKGFSSSFSTVVEDLVRLEW